MSVKGSVVTSTAPRPDWNQKNPSKADFILNKEFVDEHIASKDNPHGSADIPRTAAGSVVVVANAGDAPLQGLKIYGKTTQNGIPTPEAPIPLESVGVSKNLFGGDALADKLVEVGSATKDETAGTVTFTGPNVAHAPVLFEGAFKENTQYTFMFSGFNIIAGGNAVNISVIYTDGTEVVGRFSGVNNGVSCWTFTSAANKTVSHIIAVFQSGGTTLYYDKCGVFEGVLTEADFEPYGRSIGVTVAGKNLFDESRFLEMGFSKVGEHEYYSDRIYAVAVAGSVFTNTLGISGSFAISCKLKYFDNGKGSSGLYAMIYYTDGTTHPLYPPKGIHDIYFDYAVVTNADKTVDYIVFTYGSGDVNTHIKDFQIEYNSVATVYEPYNGVQTSTFSTPDGLHGIGEVKDEIDFARGVRVQNCKQYNLLDYVRECKQTDNTTYSSNILRFDFTNAFGVKTQTTVMCNRFENNYAHSSPQIERVREGVSSHPSQDVLSVLIDKSRLATEDLAGFTAYLQNNETIVVCQLATPIETALSAEELAAYAALHSYNPSTIVCNDSNADMEIRYCTPNAAVPMNVGSGAKGKVLGVDEHGCVVPTSIVDFGYIGEYETDDEWKAIIENCIQRMPGDTTAHASLMWHGRWSATIHKHGTSNNYVTVIEDTYWQPVSSNVYYHRRIRTLYNGIWGEWEWENPPMVVGNEYRTTERHNGKAVYSQAASFGTLPNGTLKAIEVQTPGIDDVVDYWGRFTNGTSGGVVYSDSNLRSNYTILDNKLSFTIEAPAGSQAYSATIVFKYTKG